MFVRVANNVPYQLLAGTISDHGDLRNCQDHVLEGALDEYLVWILVQGHFEFNKHEDKVRLLHK